MSVKYKGVSISGVNEEEFRRLLHSRGVRGDPNDEKSPTLADILDPHIRQGKTEVAKFIIIGLPLTVVFLYFIGRFIFLPLLLWLSL